jgi:hypothetical protein
MRNKWAIVGWLAAAAILGYSVAHWTTPPERVIVQQAPPPSSLTNTGPRQNLQPPAGAFTNTQPRQDLQTQLNDQQRQIDELKGGR